MDTGFTSAEPQKWEFRTKPAWQRLLIMTGGVIMNIVLAGLIYAGMSYTWGDNYLSTEDMKYGYAFSPQAEAMGFRDGDKIISIDGRSQHDYDRMAAALMLGQNSKVELLRGDEIVDIVIPEGSVMKVLEDERFISPRYPFVISEVTADGGAVAAGLLAGDRLVSLNGEDMVFFDDYVDALPEYAGGTAHIGVERDSAGVAVQRNFEVAVSQDGRIGAAIDRLALTPIHTKHYTLLQSIPAGFKRMGSEVGSYWKQLKMIVRPKTEAYKSIGGPLAIGNVFSSTWNWPHFWSITALISIILAVMNILPIPALDGGHVLFLLYEVVTRRRPSDNFLIYAQAVGMALLFAVMIYATWNDISRLFIK
jgi:regulator of sigma E protease